MKPRTIALNETDAVNNYMKNLKHPLKAEIEAVRKIIKNSDARICERVKWNAPSFFAPEDMVTFHTGNQKQVHLVFHHPSIVKIKSELLLGDYKDRRMMYLQNMSEVRKHKKELERIMKTLVKNIHS